MENFKLLYTALVLLAVILPEIYTIEIAPRKEGSVKPPLVVNPIDHLTEDKASPEQSLMREKRQNNGKPENDVQPAKPPNFNPLEDLILNQDKNGFKPGTSLSRVKRQYSDSESIESEEDVSDISNSYENEGDDYEGRYPYPVPIPILIGGGFGFGGGRFGGRGFGGRGFGGRGFGGRGFGGPGGFGGRGFGGGFGGRGGGFGGGFGGGRGGGGGRG